LPSGIIKRAIVEKATERGLPVIFVNPKGTSVTCPQCGEKGKRVKRDEFHCSACGFRSHADIVGAMNILKRGFERIYNNGAETGDKPVGPFQPHKTCPVPNGTGNVEAHYSPLARVAVGLPDTKCQSQVDGNPVSFYAQNRLTF